MYLIFWTLLLLCILNSQKVCCRELFEVEFEWSHINYSWPSNLEYLEASAKGKYIPENVVFTGIKVYRDKLFLTTPKYRPGVPATLTYIPLRSNKKVNQPLIPYPDWEMNNDSYCGHLQSVQSMEIDPQGIMWVIDGVRIQYNTNCPCKLLLLDLNNSGKVIHEYVFPNEVCLGNGAFLNDIVLDGDHAYMTDNSYIDPGLIVYSKKANQAWKLRDRSMFPEENAPKFSVDGTPVTLKVAIDGIALSPKTVGRSVDRTLYYSPVTGYDLFSIQTSVLKNFSLFQNAKFRDKIKLIGRKQGATDGMMMDNVGNLFYTLVSHNAVGRWNIKTPFNNATILYQNNSSMIWPDTFGITQNGYLYMTSNYVSNYLDPNVELKLSSTIKFRVWKFHSGTMSYMYD
uniref:Yellow-x4 n=1 Tax=Leptinotarsa decemlineata TaxID=7539 RepID=A0A290GSI7_LEPDE|nr:yellow-x4 [Leptinotarsa decemlineata]